MSAEDQERLVLDILHRNSSIDNLFSFVRTLDIGKCALSGGTIRNEVWNYVFGNSPGSYIRDFDIVYFDRDNSFSPPINIKIDGVPIQFSNQCVINSKYNSLFGTNFPAFNTIEETTYYFSEIATCVSVEICKDGKERVIAPFGLDDLFNGVCRPNPNKHGGKNLPEGIYYQRVKKMGIAEKYPKVCILESATILKGDCKL